MNSNEMTVIKLSGSLAVKFGREHRRLLDTGTTTEAFSAIKNTLQGFEQFIKEQAKLGMRYAIFRNGRNTGEDEFGLSGTREIRIVPVIAGGKRAGVMQTILGAVLIVVGVFTTIFGDYSGSVIQLGAAMVAGGVVQMLSPQARGLKGREAAENAPSYAFGGAVNTTAAGNPVGIGYGKRRIGGAIISAGIYAEDIATSKRPIQSGGGNGGNGEQEK
ncbi:tail assembly protein [Shewanella xiamenensis]|uniref:tail assembly protein n=1 Tax=Shewanella xiamenensis TaxID=332186 RepID=UPI0024A7A4BB|nr:tail assembly protein [Shewanella xiamenensis]MDI5837388.1 tail assembly protein [Shewanella xiamenensis]MDI5840363.1 tail assembly protein [Shewanella xiamenensis]MDI5844404.1 tail assembly protein [Shewanella xiamenensis]MDI5848006.1 tail assembly protein [Shewanella xiamenensis]MDI5852298.1 tail assembly protein [Shewanella xiamenensis]